MNKISPARTSAAGGLTFGATPLLSGAALAVAAGNRICLVGRNGSGKSTLLRIAAGLGGAVAEAGDAARGARSRRTPD